MGGMRSSQDPYSGGDQIVDQMIGQAFATVKKLVDNLPAILELAAKLDDNPLIGITDPEEVRIALGLGTMAVQAASSYAALAGADFVGTITANNLSGTNTGDQTTITGNAGTATKLATARNINGVAFDGSANITINAVDTTARLATTNNLSDLTNQATARTNLGLGTMATQAAASYALLASPEFSGTPTVPTAAPGTSNTQAASTNFVTTAIAAIVSAAPGALDTLNELAAAIGNDPNYAATVATLIGGKAAKSANLSDLASATTARTNLGLGTLATQNGTFSGTSSGTNTGDQTNITGNAGTATTFQTARTINGVSFNGSANITINAVDSTARLATANNLSDLTNAGTARTNLGLGTMAVASTASYAAKTGDNFTGTVRAPFLHLSQSGDLLETSNDYDGSLALNASLMISGTGTREGCSTFWQRYGDDPKGVVWITAKSRGDSLLDTTDPVLPGDRIFNWQLYGATGIANQFGHVGGMSLVADGAPTTQHYVPGRWTFTTATGDDSTSNPARYGELAWMHANHLQQVMFQGTDANPDNATAFKAHVSIGAGKAEAGRAPLSFNLTDAALNTIPVAGCFEVDANGLLYFTNLAGVRQKLLATDDADPVIAVNANAGVGATAVLLKRINNSAIVRLTAGSSGWALGEQFSLTYPHEFANDAIANFSSCGTVNLLAQRNGYCTSTKTAASFGISVTPLTSGAVLDVAISWTGR